MLAHARFCSSEVSGGVDLHGHIGSGSPLLTDLQDQFKPRKVVLSIKTFKGMQFISPEGSSFADSFYNCERKYYKGYSCR